MSGTMNFGGVANFTTATHSTITVGATSTAVVTKKQKRKYLILQNISNEPISIKIGSAAVANQGVMLSADSTGGATPSGDGGVYEMSPAFGNLFHESVNAICASGSKSLLVTEGE